MTTSLRSALLTVKELLAMIGFSISDELEFNKPDPDPSIPLDQLRGFNSYIEPPKMRRCCAIGWKASVSFLPDALIATEPMDVTDLGDHVYGGPGLSNLISKDPVGHIYTARGGIVDIGHARDHADLARYFASQAMGGLAAGWNIDLSNEVGTRRVELKANGEQPSPQLAARIGARISYEIAVWHEIVTWGATTMLASQPYSAFSPEDNYSNLLGAYLGYCAMLTPTVSFDEALTEKLFGALMALEPQTRTVARWAVEYVENHWYGYTGGNLELYRRHFDAYTGAPPGIPAPLTPKVHPWLITDVLLTDKADMAAELTASAGDASPVPIEVPNHGPHGEPLSDYYDLIITPDYADLEIHNWDNRTTIGSDDLPAMVDAVRADVLRSQPHGDGPFPAPGP